MKVVCEGLRPGNPLGRLHCISGYLDARKCSEIIDSAERLGQWRTDRHKNYPTCDVPASKLDVCDEITRVTDRVLCDMRERYLLGGGAVLKPYDIFVVKYSPHGQKGLAFHRDSSELSFILMLSEPSCYEGGGTKFSESKELVSHSRGELSLHCGKLLHCGQEVTEGTRYIMIGFVGVKTPSLREYSRDRLGLKMSELRDKRVLDYMWKNEGEPRNQKLHIEIRVISLLGRADKLRGLMTNLASAEVPREWSVNIAVIVANEGDKGTPYPHWRVEGSPNKYWSREVTKGEIGCFQSHMNTIKSMAGLTDYLLIMEDDARVPVDFFHRIDDCVADVPDGWDFIDLGGKPVGESTEPSTVSRSLVKLGYTYNTHCILYSKHGISHISAVDTECKIIAYDEFLSALRSQHPRRDIVSLYKCEPLEAYHPICKLSWQQDSAGDTERKLCSPVPPTDKGISPYDMVNYFAFKDALPLESVLDASKIAEMTKNANDIVWKFDISSVELDALGACPSEYEIPLASCVNRKLTVVIGRADGSTLSIRNPNKIDISMGPGVVACFPAYLPMKPGNADVWYALGAVFS